MAGENSTTGWQPIETAPRDGAFVLAFGEHNGALADCSIAIIQWWDDAGGWFSDGREYTFSPTHWMPLPEPPL